MARWVYGLGIEGLDDVSELPTDVPPSLHVTVSQTEAPPPPVRTLDGDGGVLATRDGRHLVLARSQKLARWHGPRLANDVLAHPYLGPVATTFNRWAGREAFHAGAFVHKSLAWAVLGPREAGKSTLLAAMAAHHCPVLCDDILICENLEAFAGPRCIDLREPGKGYASRDGTRWRIKLENIAPRVRLGGMLFLRWGDALSCKEVTASERLLRLARRRALSHLASRPQNLLELAALPAYDVFRPRDKTLIDETCSWLLGNEL